MPADTKGQDAQFWADQCEALRVETDKANVALDSAKKVNVDLVASTNDRLATQAKQHADALAAKDGAHAKAITALQAKHDAALLKLASESPEVKAARLAHEKEMKTVRDKAAKAEADFKAAVKSAAGA